jgi:anti-sigma regulatory factor (Ser/Thr protein kinase)
VPRTVRPGIQTEPRQSFTLLNDKREYPATPESAKEARTHADSVMRRWNVVAEGLESVVTELVSNAVLHAGGDLSFCLRYDDDTVTVEVADPSSALPAIGSAMPLESSGRGLVIVENFAHDWGVRPGPNGKVVWAELEARHL